MVGIPTGQPMGTHAGPGLVDSPTGIMYKYFFEIRIFTHQMDLVFEFWQVLVGFSHFGGFSTIFFNKVLEQT